MLSRQFWRITIAASTATALIGCQVLTKTNLVQSQISPQQNSTTEPGKPLTVAQAEPQNTPQYPPVEPAKWGGWTSNAFPDATSACQDVAKFREGSMIKVEPYINPYSQPDKPLITAAYCYIEGWHITESIGVECPWTVEYGSYIYTGGTDGVCVLPYLVQGTGPINGIVGLWQSTLPDNAYQMVVLWNAVEERYEGYLVKLGNASEQAGFKLGELVWTGTPNGATGTLTESQKWRTASNGNSYEEWRNGTASLNQNTLASSAAGTNFEEINPPKTDNLAGESGDTSLIGSGGNDTLGKNDVIKDFLKKRIIELVESLGKVSRRNNKNAPSSPTASRSKPSNQSTTQQKPNSNDIPSGIDVSKLSQVSPKSRKHILDGDENGGGHGPGRGAPTKSEFPSQWSDDKTIENISDVIKSPDSRWTQQTGKLGAKYTNNGKPVRWQVEGTRDGIDIKVIVEPDGQGIVTAFPTNVPRNP